MATVTENVALRDKLGWYAGHCHHEEWDKFSPLEQERMVNDDLSAGRNVSLILVSLIAAGLVLCAVTLLAVVLTS